MIKDTLKKYLDKLGMTQKALSEQSGVSEQTVSGIITGKIRRPRNSTVDKIVKALEKAEEDIPINDNEKYHIAYPDLGHRDALQLVPLINFADAGEFHEFSEIDYPYGWASEFIFCTEKDSKVFALEIKGSSMEPIFIEGDKVIINPNKRVNHGDKAVVKMLKSGETTIKKVEYFDQGKVVVLRPLNERYKAFEIKEEDQEKRVRIIGRVMELIRKF